MSTVFESEFDDQVASLQTCFDGYEPSIFQEEHEAFAFVNTGRSVEALLISQIHVRRFLDGIVNTGHDELRVIDTPAEGDSSLVSGQLSQPETLTDEQLAEVHLIRADYPETETTVVWHRDFRGGNYTTLAITAPSWELVQRYISGFVSRPDALAGIEQPSTLSSTTND